MIEIIKQFVVRDDARGQFELTFGPGGAWSGLFARCPGFRGTTVLRDTADPRRYLTIELWDSAADREKVLRARGKEHSALDASLGSWVESSGEVGVFRMMLEATVRPLGKGGPRRGRGS